MKTRYIIGIDLSGPSNTKDTALVCFEDSGKGDLKYHDNRTGAGDQEILDFIDTLPGNSEKVIGIDAPLSYNPGGGDRPGDKSLRKKIVALGMKSGSVMTPTMMRMSYLTLRGISLARSIQIQYEDTCKIVEVHPGAALALHGAPIKDILTFKKDTTACKALLRWMKQQGVDDINGEAEITDHYVAGCASAMAAWKWYGKNSKWMQPTELPFHPFDFAC